MKYVIGAVLFTAGTFLNFFGGFCILGGPEGAFMSSASIQCGVPVLFSAAFLLYLAKLLLNTKAYVFAPLGASIFAWLLAFFGAHYFAFNFFVIGTPVSFLAIIIYYLVSLGSAVQDRTESD
jgi:hypothetical protein